MIPEYQHALVVGPDRSYLWILSRSPSLPEAVVERLVGKAAALGFDTSSLIYVGNDQAAVRIHAKCEAVGR